MVLPELTQVRSRVNCNNGQKIKIYLNKNLLVLSFSFILPDIKAKTLVLKKFKKLNMGIEPAISVLTALSSTIVPQDPHIL